MSELKFPAPYFGGKSVVADKVWAALGQPKHFVEPFFGSGAVLLARPNHDQTNHVETVNDKDGHLCNVWRSLQYSPDETARWCDWPVNHADLNARRKVLIANEERLLQGLIADDNFHDPKLAGYWIWAASCWIGSGLTRSNAIPHLTNAGKGVHKISQRPHLTNAGVGVHKISKIPHIGDAGMGVTDPYNENIYKWFRQLSERLRYVRVVCGDWKQVCSGNWQDKIGDVGIFFDPPYGVTDRDIDVYHHDSTTIAAEAAQWAAERGKLPTYRIVFAGYSDENSILDEAGWRRETWKTTGGYGNTARSDEKTQGQINRHRECLWYSPYCINTSQAELSL